MFKKFKDKLAEEMKQSPSRLQAGMQQLAQAVISPAASNNLIQDMTTSVDDLNLTSEEADILRNNSATNHFQSVDLQATNSMERSRRSSFSSVTSENFFPSYESPGNLYHLQSDMEQSASEFEDSSSSSQLEHVTKDELYAGYQKLRTKYTKYRAVYRELYKENMKMKSVLVETQDKALRRIANLKEQCQLEQEAKAHLEEALRTDMEEKDHVINTLTTKIKLLQANGSSAESIPTPESDGRNEKSNFDLLTGSTSTAPSANDNLIAENSALREKVKKFETLLAKCNESLKKNKEKISQLTEDRDILERDLNVLRNSDSGRTEMLESEVYRAEREILSLKEQVDVLKKREEDSALSLAENKLFIHRELEVKEEQNKQLQQDLKRITEYKDILADAVVRYDHEFKQFGVAVNDRSLDSDKKVSHLQDLFTNKFEALKLIQQDVKHRIIGSDEDARSKHDKEIKQKKESSAPLQGTVGESTAKNEEISWSRDELEIKNAQLLGLETELKSCKSTINDLKEMLRDVTMDWEQANKEKECLIANILDYKKIIGKLRRDCDSVKAEIMQNYSGQEAIINSMNKKITSIFNSAEKHLEKKAAESVVEPEHENEKESKDPNVSESISSAEASSVELKTMINDNNALRKRCEQLSDENAQMISKVNNFDKINLTNIKLIAEIDELNFKLRDIAELQETQDKLQLEMEGLKGKSPFGNNIADSNAQFTNQVSSLKERLNNYDILTKENTELKQKLVVSRNELTTALNNMEELKSEQSKNLELGIDNFSQKCAQYESMIVNLTSKFTEQTLQLEKLQEELAKQKTSFQELNNRHELGSAEFKETNDAFVKQSLEMKELNEKYKTQCSVIEKLREKETEILNQLDETVKVRQEMIAKFDELESVIETRNKELEELKLSHQKLQKDLESSEETKKESLNFRTDEILVLTKDKAELIEEVERLRTRNGEIEIVGNNNTALQLELEKLEENNVEVTRNNTELKEECSNLSELNEVLKISQNNLHQENDELKGNLLNLGNDLQCLQERLDAERTDFEEQISGLNKELENAREEARTAAAMSTELRETVDALEAQGREQAALGNEAETRRVKLAAEVNELKLKLEEFKDVYQANMELEKRIENLNPKVQTLDDLEAKNVELLKEIEELNRKIDTLRSLEDENRILNSEVENFKRNITELETTKAELSELRNELKISNESKLESSTEVEALRKENQKLAMQVENLQDSVNQKAAELNSLENSHTDLVRELEAINSNHSKTLDDKSKAIAELEKTIKDLESKMVEHRQEFDALQIINKELHNQLEELKADHLTASEYKTGKISELEKTAKDLENKIVEDRREVDTLKTINEELRDQLAKINSDHSKALEDKAKTITELEKAAKDFENKLIGRREEVDGLEATNKNLREQLISVSQNKNADEALMQSYNNMQEENKELRTRLDKAVILYETKESQIEILNQELKRQTQMLTDKLKTNEDEQCMRIKQLVKEFQAQIHDKDEQIQAALEKRFERQQNYESELIQQYKEQLKDFQIELTAKSEQIESLILDNKGTIQAYKDQIEELTQAITQVKKEHADELQDIEQNWKTVLKQRTDQLETKHVDEVNELTKEWLNERKTAASSDSSPVELEGTSRVAMATIQSNTGSLHSLQQTLLSQKRELSELRKLLRIRNESLEGSTEIEYLRNILFEYMMGRETLVLTRVISAVVKFDQEQTTKVLKKEEDKLTLLGSLGLL